MKRLAAGVLTLAIATGLSATVHAAPAARPLAANGEASGEITSATALNYSDGSRSQLFSLQLAAGQAVSLKLDGPLNGTLAVFHRDMLVGRTECGCENGAQLSVRADKAGQYLVAVSGADPRAFGPFHLSATPIVAYDGKPLAAGQRITDWLNGERQTYTLQVDKPGLYTLNLESDAFDARLELSGNGVSLEDDDGGNGTNARLVAPLQPGSYTLTAAAFSQSSGAFYLGVEQADFPEGLVFADGSALPLEGQASGFVGADETRSFVFSLPDRRRVQFDASSRDIDPLLSLQGADITLSDDDGGGGVNARLSQVLDPGEYNISVRSVNGRGGIFQIATGTAPAPDADPPGAGDRPRGERPAQPGAAQPLYAGDSAQGPLHDRHDRQQRPGRHGHADARRPGGRLAGRQRHQPGSAAGSRTGGRPLRADGAQLRPGRDRRLPAAGAPPVRHRGATRRGAGRLATAGLRHRSGRERRPACGFPAAADFPAGTRAYSTPPRARRPAR
ncbi:hypothetical protein [Stenotrophomonas nitritireducens]|uniref:hypothetical protein n=1 Tax=Stenotrophomonas nitritireducens TaxID=83617 RepID=UPI003D967D88